MQNIHQHILLTQQATLVSKVLCTSAGISENTIKLANRRNSDNWDFVSVPGFPYLFLKWQTLKAEYKTIVEHYLKDTPENAIKKATLLNYVFEDYEARSFYHQYLHPNTGDNLSNEEIEQYTRAASWLNMIQRLQKDNALLKSLGFTKESFWSALKTLIKNEGVKIPANRSKLSVELSNYKQHSYSWLVCYYKGNSNAKKRNEESEQWLIGEYGKPAPKISVEMLWLQYGAKAKQKGWKVIESPDTLYKFLHRPEIIPQWIASREGLGRALNDYAYRLKTHRASCANALWYGDGTKINLYYRDGNGRRAKLWVYEVMDDYSEAFIGYSIWEDNSAGKEGTHAQIAFKEAVKTSGCRPFQIVVDNQGGTRMEFLNKVGLHAWNSQPNNPQSKSIESAFGRFQSQFLRQLWFFTGMNNQAKSDRSKANMEFIMANTQNLPSKEEAIAAYIEKRNQWNNAPHHQTGVARIEMYRNSENTQVHPLTEIEHQEIFYEWNELPITYYASGIKMVHRGADYDFEVVDAEGYPNTDFRQRFTLAQFYVRYNPDDLSHILLYKETSTGNLQFVAKAIEAIRVHRAVQDHAEGESCLVKALFGEKGRGADRQWLINNTQQTNWGELINPYGEKVRTKETVAKAMKEETDLWADDRDLSIENRI